MKNNKTKNNIFSAFLNNSKAKKALVISLVLLICSSLLVTLSLLVKVSPALKNVFSTPSIKNEINEQFDETEKKSVTVKNIGDANEYVRAAVVINWKDANGNVYSVAPKSTDYTVSYNETDWKKVGKYWYYKTSLAPNASTNNLLGATSVKQIGTAPEGYTLSVEIIAEGIQSNPDTAVKEAWGITAKNGSLVFD